MKEGMKMVAKNFDEYLAAIPAKERAVPEELRRTIKGAAPNAKRCVRYGIPAFMYH